MPWMPAPAKKRQIDWLNNLSRGGVAPNAIVLHVTASEATSQYSYFSSQRNAGSHFHVARDGTIEQYAGTGARSAADYGSKRTISIETQGNDDKGWTSAQIDSIARVVAWCADTHNIPLRLMASSKTSEKGLGWHRLGIDGNFPSLPDVRAGRKQRGGGETWSGSTGKSCPMDSRIYQVDDVLAKAKQYAGGGSGGGSGGGDDSSGDDDMPGWKNLSNGDDRTITADGEYHTLSIDKSEDGKSNYYSVLTGPAYASGTLYVSLVGLEKGHEVDLRFVLVDVASGKDTVVAAPGSTVEFIAGSSTTSIAMPFTSYVTTPDAGYTARKLRFQIRAYGGEKVTIQGTRVRMLYWKK